MTGDHPPPPAYEAAEDAPAALSWCGEIPARRLHITSTGAAPRRSSDPPRTQLASSSPSSFVPLLFAMAQSDRRFLVHVKRGGDGAFLNRALGRGSTSAATAIFPRIPRAVITWPFKRRESSASSKGRLVLRAPVLRAQFDPWRSADDV